MSTYNLTCSFALGPAYAGLVGTIGYKLYDAAFNPVGGRLTAGFFESGPGNYALTAPLVLGSQGYLQADTGGGSPFYTPFIPINPSDGYLDVAVSSRAGAAGLAVLSPLTGAGDLSIVQGASYQSSEGSVLSFPGAGVDLTGSAVSLSLYFATGTQTFGGALANPGLATQSAQVELTAAQTAAMPAAGAAPYLVTATLPNGHVVPLRSGAARVGVT